MGSGEELNLLLELEDLLEVLRLIGGLGGHLPPVQVADDAQCPLADLRAGALVPMSGQEAQGVKHDGRGGPLGGVAEVLEELPPVPLAQLLREQLEKT